MGANQSQNAHTSIVVRNQINIINNGTQSSSTGPNNQKKPSISQHNSSLNGKPTNAEVSRIVSGSNTRSKVSTRKPSTIQAGKQHSNVYVPSQSQMGMYSGLDANNLVNFYNSNILDEMLQKGPGKFINKNFVNNVNPHLRKSA